VHAAGSIVEGSMARPLRIEYQGACYHVTARGNERRRIYRTKSDYLRFKRYLNEAQEKHGYILHCYVLMPNHYHLLMETPNGNLSKVMHYIGGSYANYFNIRNRRIGHLFQGRYKAIVIDRDSYLLELSRYLHLNPVRAQLAKNPGEYAYSSYRSYTSDARESMVCRDLILGMVGGRGSEAMQRYRDFVDEAVPLEQESPLKQVHAGAILGRESFVEEVLARVGEKVLQSAETSQRRALRTGPRVGDVLDMVRAGFGVSREQVLTENRGNGRKAAIYLLKKHTGMTNGEIGELFGGLTYSAVAKVCGRFSKSLATDAALRAKLRVIEREMSKVKG
jgi:putative transposase